MLVYGIRGEKTGLTILSFCVHWKALGRKIAGFPVQQGTTLVSAGEGMGRALGNGVWGAPRPHSTPVSVGRVDGTSLPAGPLKLGTQHCFFPALARW